MECDNEKDLEIGTTIVMFVDGIKWAIKGDWCGVVWCDVG